MYRTTVCLHSVCFWLYFLPRRTISNVTFIYIGVIVRSFRIFGIRISRAFSLCLSYITVEPGRVCFRSLDTFWSFAGVCYFYPTYDIILGLFADHVVDSPILVLAVSVRSVHMYIYNWSSKFFLPPVNRYLKVLFWMFGFLANYDYLLTW